MAATLARFGRIDLLVSTPLNNTRPKSCQRFPRSRLRRHFVQNNFGYIFMAQAVLKHMRKGTAIVNTASVTAYHGSLCLVDCAATKGGDRGLHAFAIGSACEKGIRVNAVAPGPIWTPSFLPASTKRRSLSLALMCPFMRAGQPTEVAPAYLFLARDDSTYFTG